MSGRPEREAAKKARRKIRGFGWGMGRPFESFPNSRDFSDDGFPYPLGGGNY